MYEIKIYKSYEGKDHRRTPKRSAVKKETQSTPRLVLHGLVRRRKVENFIRRRYASYGGTSKQGVTVIQ